MRNEGVALSIEFLHWSAKRRDGLPPAAEDTTLVAAQEALGEDGQAPEEDWPYSDARDQTTIDYHPSQDALDHGLIRRLTGGSLIDPTAAEVRAALQSGHPVVLGIQLHATWHYVAEDGHIAMPSPGAPTFGGHAVVVVGHRRGDLIIQNSWGTEWGDAGNGYISDEHVDTFGIAAWALAM
jgi:hypothetical protein